MRVVRGWNACGAPSRARGVSEGASPSLPHLGGARRAPTPRGRCTRPHPNRQSSAARRWGRSRRGGRAIFARRHRWAAGRDDRSSPWETHDQFTQRGSTYDEVWNNFKWNIPQQYNIADDVCERWADDPDRIALIYEDAERVVTRYTFADIRRHANQLANTLRGLGLVRGDRVTLLLAQDPECAIAHVACWKAGMISGPCSVLFGSDAIAYRLNDSGARALITDSANYPKVAAVRAQCPQLEHVFVIEARRRARSISGTRSRRRARPSRTRRPPPRTPPGSATRPVRPACPRARCSHIA